MIRETVEPCPSCYYPYAHYYHDTEGKSPDEIYCPDCGFEWQVSRGNMSPDDEATAHRGLRDEAIAYREERVGQDTGKGAEY